MSECERTTAYLDGELPEAEHAAAIEHLATCARCQADAADFVGIEAALASERPAAAAPAPRRRAWIGVALGLAVAAALALVVLLRGGGDDRDRAPAALALAGTRAVEARFTAAPFDRHRPYRVTRDGAARELVSLEALARLERAGDLAGIAAAHVLAGEPARAAETLAAAAPSPARDSDLAAIALAAGDPEAALVHADRALAAAPELTAARWNRALALRELDLPLAAAAELERVAAAGEPGWAAEARERAAALAGAYASAADELAAFTAAGRAMIARAGPPLDEAAVRRRPGPARIHFFDALRGAASADEVRALAPLAAALDAEAGTDHARRALERVLARDLAVRARFAPRYRAFVAGELDAAAAAALEDELRRAGAAVDDLWLGVVILRGRLGAERARAAPVVAALDDPWFALFLVREDARAALAAGDPFTAERQLAAAAATCDADAWALRCAAIDETLAEAEAQLGRLDEAARRAGRARAGYARAGALPNATRVLALLADLHWLRDRAALALAYADEYRRRATGCAEQLFADELTALVLLAAGDVAGARAHLPAAGRCDAPPSAARIVTAVGIARLGDARDRAAADALIEAARADRPALAELAAARLAIDADPGAAARVRAAIAAPDDALGGAAEAAELRTWGWATLIGDAGRRGDWAAGLARFEEELGRAAPAGCVVAASSDDERSVAIARGADGALRGAYQGDRRIGRLDAATIVPPDLAATLAGCPSIAVIARPPLHGAPDLLPPALPWAFVGPASRSPAPRPARPLIVDDVRPPPSLALPALRPAAVPDGAARLTGAAATPSRVRAALRDATYVELHAHGVVDASTTTSFLALSPEADGDYALTAAAVRDTPLAGAPVVVLVACRTATVAPALHRRWSLPDAFVGAGARAVIATADPVPDDEVAPMLAELRARLARGEPPAQAVAALRSGKRWQARWIVFE